MPGKNMKLSNKKIKYIHRHAAKKNPETLAKELRINIKEVENALGISKREPIAKKQALLDRVPCHGLFVLAFLAPFVFINGIYDFANLPQMVFIQLGVVVVFLLWLLKNAIVGKWMIVRSPFYGPIFSFILWSLISLTYAHNKYEGTMVLMHWAACVLMFFLVLNIIRSKNDSIRFMITLLASGCFIALLGIFQYVFDINWVPQVVPPAATFANKNMAVQFIIVTLPLSFSLMLLTENRGFILTLSFMAALMIVYIVYTKSQSGWLALILSILFFTGLVIHQRYVKAGETFWNRDKTLAATLTLVIILIMISLSTQELKQDLQNLVAVEETDRDAKGYTSSALLRLHIWTNTWEMIKDRPVIGFGLGNHKVFYPLYVRKAVTEKQFSETSQLTHVHNDYLQMGAELGLVGMVFLGWLGFLLIRIVVRLTQSTHSRFVRFSTIGISTAVIGFLIDACFSFPVHRALPPFVVMSLIGLLAALYAGDEPKHLIIRKRWVILCTCVIVFLGAIWLVRFHIRALKCDRHYLNISSLEKQKNWKGVIEEGRWAYAYFPQRLKILSYIGRAYIELDRPKEGIEVLKKVIQGYPNHMNALLNIGVAYGKIGEHALALKAYDQVLRIKPDYAKVHNNMANIYMHQKDLDNALKEFRIAAELDPKNSFIHFNIGIAEMQKGRYKEAAMSLETALAINPESDLIHKHLGILYFQYLNRKQDGIDHFTKALAINPKLADADRIRNLIKNHVR